jgi:anti-anti-sigma factor
MARHTQILIDAYRSPTKALVELRGRLTLGNSESVRKRLHELIAPNIEKYYLDMRELEYVDSGGWGIMVGLKVALGRNRSTLLFLSPNDRVMDIFRISKLDSIFEILGGIHADEVRREIGRDEHLVWRDSPDEAQARYNTEAYFTPPAGDGLSPVPRDASFGADTAQRIAELARQAVEYLRFGDYPRVIETYQKVLELDPEDISALNNLGVVYEKRPEWRASAIETWTRVQDLSEQRRDGKHADRARRHLDALRRSESA